MSKKRKTIYIDDNECGWVKNDLWIYRGQYLAFVKELPDGSDEMAYCDENENILPDSPRVISIPGQKDFGDVIWRDE